MQTVFNHTISKHYSGLSVINHLWIKFIDICNTQEKNRLLWVGIILATHGCIITPVTAMLTFIGGPHLFLFITVMTAMGIALVTNLAAMPTKITLPVYVLSILIDVAVATISIARAM